MNATCSHFKIMIKGPGEEKKKKPQQRGKRQSSPQYPPGGKRLQEVNRETSL